MADEPGPGGLSHLDASGAARMVDVSAKAETARVATAEAIVRMQPETLALIQEAASRRATSSRRRASPASWPRSARRTSFPSATRSQ